MVMDTEMPYVGSILWAKPINEVLTTNGPAEKLYKPEEGSIFSLTQFSSRMQHCGR